MIVGGWAVNAHERPLSVLERRHTLHTHATGTHGSQPPIYASTLSQNLPRPRPSTKPAPSQHALKNLLSMGDKMVKCHPVLMGLRRERSCGLQAGTVRRAGFER